MEEKKERPTLPFGKEIKIGNWKVLKFTRALSKSQLKGLRAAKELPDEVRKFARTGIPYIKVEAISGVFSLTFAFNTQVFRWLDYCIPAALEVQEGGEIPDQNSIADILHVFGMWMADVCTAGDQKYYEDKANALKGLVERQKSIAGAVETAEEKAEDDKILEEVKEEEEQKAVLMDMAKEVAMTSQATEEEKAEEDEHGGE
jgi:hypothetical protein